MFIPTIIDLQYHHLFHLFLFSSSLMGTIIWFSMAYFQVPLTESTVTFIRKQYKQLVFAIMQLKEHMQFHY